MDIVTQKVSTPILVKGKGEREEPKRYTRRAARRGSALVYASYPNLEDGLAIRSMKLRRYYLALEASEVSFFFRSSFSCFAASSACHSSSSSRLAVFNAVASSSSTLSNPASISDDASE